MSAPSQQTDKGIVSRDMHQTFVLHRDAVASADSNIVTSPAGLFAVLPTVANQTEKAFDVAGAKTLLVRVFARAAADATCDGGALIATVVGWPPQYRDSENVPYLLPGRILYQGTVTCGTSFHQDYHPFTGAVVSGGARFHEADTVTDSTADAATDGLGTNVNLYNASGHNRQSVIAFDPLGSQYIFVYLTAFNTGSPTIDKAYVGIQRL